MKRSFHLIAFLVFPLLAIGQVELDTEIRLIGEEGQRGVDGLGTPTEPSSAITVEGSVLGIAHWSDAVLTENSIALTQPVPVEEYRPGMLLRFISPADISGPLVLHSGDLPELPMLRTDGLQPAPGQITAGMIVEVVHAVDRWIVMNLSEKACPPGSLAVHAGLCMDSTSVPQQSYVYQAMDHCQAQGGKLCTWDEYYLGCTVLGDQLANMFVDWEWLDETSNHTHAVDQAGRYTCKTQRSTNPVLTLGRTRCCYHLR